MLHTIVQLISSKNLHKKKYCKNYLTLNKNFPTFVLLIKVKTKIYKNG